MFVSSISDEIANVHQTIEDNKKPYLFTNQTGEELDSTGYFLGCPRLENESDTNYIYRLMDWMQSNATCNATSIENKCKELQYSSATNYVPYTKGIGTATIYLIPKSYSEEDKQLALNEAQQKVSVVINPSSRVEFKIPEPRYIRFVAYLDITDGYDAQIIKNEIITNIKNYVNSIAPGDKMYLGQLNKIGLAPKGVEYFNIVQIYIDEEESTDFEILQVTEAKFIFDEFIWWNVEG